MVIGMNMVLMYITNPSKEGARKISKKLLEEKLIACANIFPIESIYLWEGKIAEEPEFVLIAKTTEENFGKAKALVEKIHPYDVPCVLKIPVEANERYLKWVQGVVGRINP